MIVEERYVSYINSLNAGNDDLLTGIEREAAKDLVPIIRTETQQFLKTLLALYKPEAILEVGTAIGFSSILMARSNPAACRITTIENYAGRIPAAKRNIHNAGLSDVITLIEGDAADVLQELAGPFDLIFMDAAKGQYIHFYPEVKRLLRPGGVLVSDNVLQDGEIIQSRFAVTRRNRTIHKRMREYLYELTHDGAFTTSILPLGDGVTVSVKK